MDRIQFGGNAEGSSGQSRNGSHTSIAAAANSSQMPGVPRRGRAAKQSLSPKEHVPPVAPLPKIVGPRADEGETGHGAPVPHHSHAGLAATIDAIREQWRRRQSWHRAEKSLTLQSKALCRRLAVDGDKAEAERIYRAALGKGEHPVADVALAAMLPLDEARKGIERHRKAVEKRLEKLAGALPVAPWVKDTRGVGLLSLAGVVGEAGDLGNYATKERLWKRLGLAVMGDGTRQRRIGGAEALDHGYSPARRSVMWNVGACIVKAGGPLKAVYDARKAYETPRVETKLHAHNRAQRFTEKRFLELLWREWHRIADGLAPTGPESTGAP